MQQTKLVHEETISKAKARYRKTPRTGPDLMQEPVADWPRVEIVLCMKVVLLYTSLLYSTSNS